MTNEQNRIAELEAENAKLKTSYWNQRKRIYDLQDFLQEKADNYEKCYRQEERAGEDGMHYMHKLGTVISIMKYTNTNLF